MKTKIILHFALSISLISFVSAQDTILVPQDYPTIQQGIDAAVAGNIILVDPGTYLENINFKGKAITLASQFILVGDTNFISNTIIDGSQPADPDSASTVFFLTGEDTTSVLCGFTITGGSGLVLPAPWPRLGGGICCINSGAKIIHNKIIGNQVLYPASATGAGVFCGNDGGDHWMIMENNIITNNTVITNDLNAWGGGISIESHARISQNIIEGNYVITGMSNASGGGVYCYSYPGNVNSVEISDNLIWGNEISGPTAWGAGIFINGSQVLIKDNLIIDNTTSGNNCGGAGIFFEPNSPGLEIYGNFITGNYNDAQVLWLGGGIGVPNPAGSSWITGNEISGNGGSVVNSAGGGIFYQEAFDFPIIVDRNTISNNYSSKGGGFYARNSYHILFSNNLFAVNSATSTGAAVNLYETTTFQRSYYRDMPRPVLVNNTFTENTASSQGGAIWCTYYDAIPVTFNNIFWDNQAANGDDIYYTGDENMIISYSDIFTNNITGNWQGEGNIHEDPDFIDDLCHINEFSPCVDVGVDSIEFNGNWYYAPAYDLEGSVRPYGAGGVDIGSYECYIFTGMSDRAGITQHSTLNIQIFPNPTGGIIDLQFTIYDLQSVSLRIYDLHGRELAVVLDEKLPAGEHVVRYDMTRLPAGVYFVELRAKGEGRRAEGIGHRVVGKVVKMD